MKNTWKIGSGQRLAAMILAAAGLAGPAGVMAGTYSETVLADNPIAYYRLEELSGATVAADSGPSGAYAGTYYLDDSGTFPELGQPGIGTNSILFHVSANITGEPRVEIPYTPDLNPSGAFAVEVWVRPTSVPASGYYCPLSNWGGNGNAYAGWFIYQTGGSSPDWVWIQKVGNIWLQAPGATKYQWHYLAASFDGSNVLFYVDGQYQAQAKAADAAPNSSEPLYIGCRDPGEFEFDGNVDELALYTNALTALQIQTHYQAGLTNIRIALTSPYITSDPVDTTAYAGHSVTFQAGADGTAPLSYQWLRNNVAIDGATDDSVTFTCAIADNNAGYAVVVTNLYGSVTSATATLTVSTGLVLDAGPDFITRSVGSMAAFRVTPDGALPFSFQWYKGTTAIPGATDQTLWLTNVQLTDDGSSYYAQVTNPYGGRTNSDPATLSVVARVTQVPITRYALVVTADNPVAYWRLDQPDASTATVDAVGSFDGATDDNGGQGTITFGVPTGIPHETNTAMAVSGGATVQIPYALELNPYGPFSVEGWFEPASVAAAGVEDWRSVMGSLGNGANGPSGWHLYQGTDLHWYLIVWAGSWSDTGWLEDTDDTIAANTWYHLVIAYDGTLFKLYVNNVLRFALPWADFVQNGDSPLVLGWGYSGWNPFDGVMDDVAVYNKELTAAQVEAHYYATVRLTITETAGKIVLSWPFGTLQSATSANGTYSDLPSAVSPYTVTPGSTAFYRVKAY